MTGLYATTRIGAYSPFAGRRYAVFLTIQLEPDDFDRILDGLLGRNDNPFILVAPTRELCDASAEQRLNDRQSVFLPLTECVTFGEGREFRLIRPLDDILGQFNATNRPVISQDNGTTTFPTPPDANWSDVKIRFKDGHTVAIAVKSTTGVANYFQMGMEDKRRTGPNSQWKLLEKFAEGKGVLDWSSEGASPNYKKHKERLSANLRAYFRLDGDPFEYDRKLKGWRTRFQIRPDW